MQNRARGKLNPKKFINLHANFWFLPIWAGVFFGIGYSITKNIYVSRIHTESNLSQLKSNKKFFEILKPAAQSTYIRSINQIKNQPTKDKKMEKVIYLPSFKHSNLRLKINYSQVQNLKNQALFRTNQNFFAKETVNSLMKTLRNTKKSKSSRVEAE